MGLTAVRDVALVALFECIRAIRTWRAVALLVLYLVVSAGASYGFVELIGELEAELAETLGVPATEQTGVMLDRLLADGTLRRILSDLVSRDGRESVDEILRYPVLAIFHLWLSILLMPFGTATVASESISGDLATRALRFEAVRTGRLELVTGRFLGQAVLTGVASIAGSLGSWSIGMLYLYGTDPLELGGALLWLGLRAWGFSLAFVGLGIGVSQWTSSPNGARVAAILGTAGAFILYQAAAHSDWGLLSDVLTQLLPQGWAAGVWGPEWPLTVLFCAAFGYAWVGLGYVRFAGRDL